MVLPLLSFNEKQGLALSIGSTVLTTPSVDPGEACQLGPTVVRLQNSLAPRSVLGMGEVQSPLDFQGNTEMPCFSGRETMQGML